MMHYYFDENGEKKPNHEAMAAQLLIENVLFIGNGLMIDSSCSTLMVNVSDIFKREMDFEPISRQEIPNLFRAHEEYGYNGVIKWAAVKRRLKPMPHIEESLIADEFWDSALEKLRKNRTK